MSVILTVYSKQAFKRFLLPAINNADYDIFMAEGLFDLPYNISIKLENADNEWFFRHTEDYEIRSLTNDKFDYKNSIVDEQSRLSNDYVLLIGGKHLISIITQYVENSLVVYEHYDLTNVGKALTIGRDSKADISYDFEDKHLLSSQHGTLFKNGNKYYYQDMNSSNGSYINNRRINGSVELSFGDCIDLFGLRLVFLGDSLAINTLECNVLVNDSLLKKVSIHKAKLIKPNDRNLVNIFHRSPRQIRRLETSVVKIDEPPASKEQNKRNGILLAIGSALCMSLPMLLGCAFMIYASRVSGISRGIFMYVGLITAVTSTVIGTIRGIVGMRRAQKEYAEYETLRSERYGTYLKNIEKRIQIKYDRNTKILNERYVSVKECVKYGADTPALWNRNLNQVDFLNHRIGLGNIPFQVEIQIPEEKFTMIDNNLMELPEKIKQSFSTLKNVPICVDLLSQMLIGVIGGKRLVGGIEVVRDLIVQIAANNAYSDVKIALIYDHKQDALDEVWDFVRWLPHTWSKTKTSRYIASNKEEASNVFYELNRVIQQRIENQVGSDANHKGIIKPFFVIIIASPDLLDGEIISKYILEPIPSYGISTIYMVEQYEQLPNNCECIVENDSFHGIYNVADDVEERTNVSFDHITAEEADSFARRIANITVQEIEESGDIPDSVSFLELYGVKSLDELEVENRWKKNRTYESMKALIGLKGGSNPCYLDIHEKYHGPHGLVAGTTGSGKSETLQTYILSLAINFSPDDVSFFIIDYKGGGMANLFEKLPHMIGQISNLSGNQINRALVAIQSEKERREAIFANYGVKDIRDYTKIYKSGEASVPVPHLIIVIDEFAEMKKEEPEFIQEVISLSRVGRSLGIHLIMATQKPSGSVSDDIWANSRFKLCLRVQSKQDSMDMLHRPDAAYLTQSGRCYLQVGNDELFDLFQSGYSGAPYIEADERFDTDVAKMLTIDGASSIEGNHAKSTAQREKKISWINTVLSYVKNVAGNDKRVIADFSRTEQEDVADLLFKKFSEQKIDYPENEHNRENLITLLECVGEYGFDASELVDHADSFTNAKKKLPQKPDKTQLEAVVEYLRGLAEEKHYLNDFSLFLPLLPSRVGISELPDSRGLWDEHSVFDGEEWPIHSGNWTLETCIGLYDDPENQRQDVMTVSFDRIGNLLLFGAPNSGKSTFLQTMVYGLIKRYAPSELNIYILEMSAHKFDVFNGAPHIGGIIKENDAIDKFEKLFMMIRKELAIRKNKLGDIGFGQFVKNNGYTSMPAILIIIDGFNGFHNLTGETYYGDIMTLTKEGINAGIFFTVSSGGINSNEMPNSLAQNFRTSICLELNNIYDYATYMRAARSKVRPESGIQGRGIGYVGERILEFQTALPVNEENEVVIKQYIQKQVEIMENAWNGDHARLIPEIPEKPAWNDFIATKDACELASNNYLLPIGYDAATAEITGISLSHYYVLLITGAPKKGKTNAIKVFMKSAAAKRARLISVDFNNQLSRVSEEVGAKPITSEKQWGIFLDELLKTDIEQRNREKSRLKELGAEEEDIYAAMLKYEPIYIFIDNFADFIDRLVNPKEEGVPSNTLANMEMLISKGMLHNVFWIVSTSKDDAARVSSTNIYKLFVKDCKGMHLGGATRTTGLSGMNFENFDRRSIDAIKPAGRAMLPMNNEEEVREIVLPIVKAEKF